MINHNNIAVRWLGLAEEIAQLAEKLPAGGDREIAEKLVARLKSGASQESALLFNIVATQERRSELPTGLSVQRPA